MPALQSWRLLKHTLCVLKKALRYTQIPTKTISKQSCREHTTLTAKAKISCAFLGPSHCFSNSQTKSLSQWQKQRWKYAEMYLKKNYKSCQPSPKPISQECLLRILPLIQPEAVLGHRAAVADPAFSSVEERIYPWWVICSPTQWKEIHPSYATVIKTNLRLHLKAENKPPGH